jgi:hypothetical protein
MKASLAFILHPSPFILCIQHRTEGGPSGFELDAFDDNKRTPAGVRA